MNPEMGYWLGAVLALIGMVVIAVLVVLWSPKKGGDQ